VATPQPNLTVRNVLTSSTAVTCPTCALPAAIATEVTRLRQELLAIVPQDSLLAPNRDPVWISLARQAIAAARITVLCPQLLVVVDRNPTVQRLAIVLADPNGPWRVIGGSRVSTGEAGRLGYFITPTGVFVHNGDILDYRALGTFNEYHIRGLGVKGMRVWDFGWQVAQKGWKPKGETGKIRLLLHATDPEYLAPLLGRPASKGCIRITTAMNRFLDMHGVLDREYEELARYAARYRAVLLPHRQPTILAGDKLVVVDSSGQAACSCPPAVSSQPAPSVN